MVVGDNSTRWNSTYDSITRAIDLYPAIQLFYIENEDDLGQDIPTRETWDDIKDHAHGLKPFKDLTMELQSRATSGNHGSGMGDFACFRATSRPYGADENQARRPHITVSYSSELL